MTPAQLLARAEQEERQAGSRRAEFGERSMFVLPHEYAARVLRELAAQAHEPTGRGLPVIQTCGECGWHRIRTRPRDGRCQFCAHPEVSPFNVTSAGTPPEPWCPLRKPTP